MEISSLITSNLTGVLFGLLMYQMANTSIKKNTEAINNLVLYLRGKDGK